MVNNLIHPVLKRASLLFMVASTAWGSPVDEVSTRDIRRHMSTLMGYHIEFSKMEPLIIERSLKVFIQQFDPEKVYFLQSEVAPYFELTSAQTDKVLRGYGSDDYFEYLVLAKSVQKAVERAKKLRLEVAREMALGVGLGSAPRAETYLDYASDEDVLKERLRNRARRIFLAEKEAMPQLEWNAEQREKLFSLWEKRFERGEARFAASENQQPINILKSLAKSLDSHTAFYSAREARDFRARLEKEFEGVGVVLRETIEGISIAAVTEGGPADKNGQVQPGDQLIAINGKKTENLTYEEVLGEMRRSGKEGLKLALVRDGDTHFVSLKKEKILMQEDRVKAEGVPFKDGQFVVLTLPSFYESNGGKSSCERDIRHAFERVQRMGKVYGVILDLRENSGGFLKQAVKVGGLFINNGVIVASKYSGDQMRYLRDHDGKVMFSGPMIALTSKMSASAAEIVAGALQDHGSALVVGDKRTYGKGSIQIQTITSKGSDAFYKVTVGRYYTASGKSTQIHGVPADIVLPSHFAGYHIGERYLEYPLPNDRIQSFITPAGEHDKDGENWLGREFGYQFDQKSPRLTHLISHLREKSEERQFSDPQFNKYLTELTEGGKLPRSRLPIRRQNSVSTDFQVQESLNILRDIYAYEGELTENE